MTMCGLESDSWTADASAITMGRLLLLLCWLVSQTTGQRGIFPGQNFLPELPTFLCECVPLPFCLRPGYTILPPSPQTFLCTSGLVYCCPLSTTPDFIDDGTPCQTTSGRHSNPWQVAITRRDHTDQAYRCGGVLVDQTHVLTVAHCVAELDAGSLVVRLGVNELLNNNAQPSFVERNVSKVTFHPKFYAGDLQHDIAVLALEHSVTFKNHIRPACLPRSRPRLDFLQGLFCWSVGWGKDTISHNVTSATLMAARIELVSSEECGRAVGTRMNRVKDQGFIFHRGFRCARGVGSDLCQVDSGSAVLCDVRRRALLAGLTAWSLACGDSDMPMVMVDVSFYRSWIQRVVQ